MLGALGARAYRDGVGLDADLIAYYDAEARAGTRTGQGDFRRGVRHAFGELLRSEGRHRIVDVGAGPGLDTAGWQEDGFDVVGVDLTEANVRLMRDRGLRGATGSLYALPFRDATFEGLWTMSTFVHVPHTRFDEAISEMLRVVAPGAPLGIGTWGGLELEGVVPFGDLRPHRFFSLATHEQWRGMLARHGTVEVFDIHDPGHERGHDHGWEYQFAVVRAA